jgi:hypothetical protein
MRALAHFDCRSMATLILGAVCACACAPDPQKPSPLREGTYQLCEEVTGYSGEKLELKDGRFKYWFYSDVRTGEEPTYPLSGTYTIEGTTLKLNHAKIWNSERTFDKINGVDVIWREDGLAHWKTSKRIHPYAVLIRSTDSDRRPSINLLKSKEMTDRERREYEERHTDKPNEIRALLRAFTSKQDPDRTAYKKELEKARKDLNPKVPAQLVGLMGYDGALATEAKLILEEFYQGSILGDEEPPFKKGTDDHFRALETLIDAFAAATDQNALESALLVFLRAAFLNEIDLTIPEGGVRIRLEVIKNGFKSSSTTLRGPNAPKSWRWDDRMVKIIPACQKWAREQIQSARPMK